jgi:MFS family permease
MLFSPDADVVIHGIQLAVAPVFLLTAVAGMIGAIAGRLARIVDRARVVEDRAIASTDPEYQARAYQEIRELRLRGRLANLGIALLTLCSFLIGMTIIVLFVGETTDLQLSRVAVGGFLGGVASFLMALLSFLVETIIATRMLNFRLPPAAGSAQSEPSQGPP